MNNIFPSTQGPILALVCSFFLLANISNSMAQKALGESAASKIIYNFPAPFDGLDFPFTIVEIDDKTPLWAKLLYESNPNIRRIMELHNTWRKANPTHKDGHTRNYKKLIGYLIANDGIDDKGYVDLASSEEIYALQQKILKDRKKFAKANLQSKNRSANNTTWETLGPFYMTEKSGELSNRHINVYSITQCLTVPNILYAMTESGATIYKTTDKGDNWFSVSDNLITDVGSRELEVCLLYTSPSPRDS